MLNLIKEHKFITFEFVFVLLSILTIALLKIYVINGHHKDNQTSSSV